MSIDLYPRNATETVPRPPCSIKRSLTRFSQQISHKIRRLVSELAFLRWSLSHSVVGDSPIRQHENTLHNPFRESWTAAFADKMEPAILYQKIAPGKIVSTPNPDAAPLRLKDRWDFFTTWSPSHRAFAQGGIVGGWIGVSLLEPIHPSLYRVFLILFKVSLVTMTTLYAVELGRVTHIYLVQKKDKIRLLRSMPSVRGPYISVYRRLCLFPQIGRAAPLPILSSSHTTLPSAIVIRKAVPYLTEKEQTLLQGVNKSFLHQLMTRSAL